MGKGASTSKTMWINVLTLVASILVCLAGSDLIKNQETALAVIIAIQSGVNIVLRLLTKQPIDKGMVSAVFSSVTTLFKRKK